MDTDKRKVLAISGSTRKGSTNDLIIKSIAEECNSTVDIELYNGLDKLPFFSPDFTDGSEKKPKEVDDFLAKIKASDGVLICTPEYVFSLPGVLKNALEWTVSTTVFSDKPTTLITAAALGEKTHDSLFLIMKTLGAKINENARLLIKGAKGKINENGEIIDKSAAFDIKRLTDSFLKSIG